jgi:hypothetical protein
MKISQSFSAALKLLFLNAEKTQSCSFIHPTKGAFNVKITKDNRFISTHIKTAAKSQSESITYYGSFLHAVGRQLNVRIAKNGLFEIRRPGTFKHLGYTNILEIVHPTRGLQLVQKRGVGFNIVRLDKVWGTVMKTSQRFSAALKLLFLNTEKTQSCSHIHPTKGVFNVKITKDNRFISTHIKTAAKSQSESITYYGNFLDAVGRQLNVRIAKNGLFEIRRPVTYEHLGYTNILEIVHPTRGLQLVQKRGVGFNIVRLDKVMPLGLLMPANTVALALLLQDGIPQQIKAIIKNGLGESIKDCYQKAHTPLHKFHLGLMHLQGTIPEPHYNIIKRKFMRIVSGKKVGINQQNITQQCFSDFKIEAIPETGTILMLPTEKQPYNAINAEMKKVLSQVNSWLKTDYAANVFTAEKYRPHITLLHGDVLRALDINPTTLAKKLNTLFQESTLKIKFRKTQYKLFPVNKTTADLVKLAKAKLTGSLTKTADAMLLSKELSAAFLVTGLALLASASGNGSFLLGLLILILSVASTTHNLQQPLARLYKQSCAFFFNAAQNTNAILENTAEVTKALRDPIKKARINIDSRVEAPVNADVSTNICILQ